MEAQSDPNIIYGGDPDEENLSSGFASVGELLMSDLQIGGNRTAFVSFLLAIKYKGQVANKIFCIR